MRIAILSQRILDNTGARPLRRPRPAIDVGAVDVYTEFKVAICPLRSIDTHTPISAEAPIGIILRGFADKPVVEQVETDAAGRHRIRYLMLLEHVFRLIFNSAIRPYLNKRR